jgi:hypothetical protein
LAKLFPKLAELFLEAGEAVSEEARVVFKSDWTVSVVGRAVSEGDRVI